MSVVLSDQPDKVVVTGESSARLVSVGTQGPAGADLPITGLDTGRVPYGASTSALSAAAGLTFDGSALSPGSLTLTGGVRGPVFDVSHADFGASPAASASANTTAIQAALTAAVAAGGGLVRVLWPGTYLLAVQGANPYDTGHQCCLDIAGDDVALLLGPGVTLKLADGQQTDGAGPVDVIVFRDRSGISIVGAGPGASRITGNTAGQTGWTGGYSQVGNGMLVRGYSTNGGGCEDVTVKGLQFDDHFSNPLVVGTDVTGTANKRITYEHLYGFDLGEGFMVIRADGVVMRHLEVGDPSEVMVGDGIEVSQCDNVRISQVVVKGTGTPPASGAIDLFGSHGVTVSDFEVDNWLQGFQLSTAVGSGRTVEDIHICNGYMRNLTSQYGAFADFDGGPIRVSNCYFHVVAGTPNPRPFQIDVPSSAEFITFEGCIFDCGGADGGREGIIQGATKARFVGCSFSESDIKVGINIRKQGEAGTPEVHFQGCDFRSTYAAVWIDSTSGAFAPTGSIKSCDLGSPSQSMIWATNDGVFDNVDMDACVRAGDAERPAVGIPGRLFFNTDDGNLNIDNGTNWILPDGTVT